jgi:cleavage stimulation factor subunit 3
MQVFRGAVIPSATGRSRSPPAPTPPRAGEPFSSQLQPGGGLSRIMQVGSGRPPPDYGPYQGPGGGRRRY